MPLGSTQRVEDVYLSLRKRLEDPSGNPGASFPSARAVSRMHGISYQTAHRLLRRLSDEGLLVRRPASGTFIAGARAHYEGAALVFDPRCRREGSFGARLLHTVTHALTRRGIPHRTVTSDREPPLGWLPVTWERPVGSGPGVVLNDRSRSGLGGLMTDAILVDDRNGASLAAEILLQHRMGDGPLAMLAGPESDARSRARVEGFQKETAGHITVADGWFTEDGLRAAPTVLAQSPSAIFCANDRLAEGLILYARVQQLPLPPLIGFDDAPVAVHLDLASIAIPWHDLGKSVSRMVAHRLASPEAPSTQTILTPIPVLRGSLKGILARN